MTTYIFPGQGSQAKGMGAELFNEFRSHVEQADSILGYSIEKLCMEDPEQLLNRTDYTQPAIYTVSALAYFKKLKETNKEPAYAAGHSLGEYNALLAAQVFDFETGLKLVQKRGALMSQVSGGGMAAVIGLQQAEIQKIVEDNHLAELSIANYNSYKQIVISGPKELISNLKPIFVQAGAKLFIPLQVSGAFHSALMKEAQAEFAKFLLNFSFSKPRFPVIANVNAKPYEATAIATTLAAQITHPVKWTQTIEYLLSCGETQFEELGPGKVLAGLIRRIQNGE